MIRSTLLDELLGQQRDLTAVERFARVHHEAPPAARRYLERMPVSGQQLAFQVDLDACTGCKACVTACHNLNGLDDGEVWRTVGLLHGGTPERPVQQTVTTSCHHCVDPACMLGCPVNAYEKDPVTGIVKHLDDQCIGCQYCTLMCPYDAPKYNAARGIVRKCDMCSDRLAHGEAPACVQACPNSAIAIAVIDIAQAVAAADADGFLPGAPAPEVTVPTTSYTSQRALPRNMLPADFYAVNRQHAHPPLVAMLVLSQLAVGTLGAGVIAGVPAAAPLALAFVLAALAASTLHLGRPLYAFRAVLGLRTSWLSREVLGFGAFAGLAALHASAARVPQLAELLAPWRTAIGWTAFGVGALAVFTSVMVYVVTRRACWPAAPTGLRFGLTAVWLGTLAAVAAGGDPHTLGVIALVAAAIKLAMELSVFAYARARTHSASKRSALLMLGALGRVSLGRFLAGLAGGIALPALLLAGAGPVATLAAIALALSLAGELAERWLFFATASAPHMPGGVA